MDDTPNTLSRPAIPAKPRRRWLRFGLRTLLIFVAVVGCALGWLGVKLREARRQEVDVAAILKLGGSVEYDYDEDDQGNRVQNPVPPGPPWLRAVLGDDFFRDITGTELTDTPAADADLEHVRRFTKIKWLHLDGTRITDAGLDCVSGLTRLETLTLVRTQITDAGLEHLTRLAELGELHLYGAQVTPAGAAKLKKSLPDCQILR